MNVLSNLNRTQSSSGELNTSTNTTRGVSYNDLCFPKTSNYGSMKKKKSHVVAAAGNGNGSYGQYNVNRAQNRNSINSVGVDCRLSPPLHSMSPLARSPQPLPQHAYQPQPSPLPHQQQQQQQYQPYYA